jgi:phospholipid-translocating ATPase
VDDNANKTRYNLLNVIEFDSDRKRMTTIFETPDGEILVVCKGADSVVKELLKDKDQPDMVKTDGYLREYSNKGLRTLLYVSKVIPRDVYDEWQNRWGLAKTMSSGKAEKLASLGAEIEHDFELLGSTAIEDKL